MKLDQCFELGVVGKPHGLKGNVSVFLDTDFPNEYAEMESVFLLQNKNLVPFFIDSIQLKGKEAIIKFEEINSKDEAMSLKGTSLHLPLDLLPQLEGNQFYFHEIEGFSIHDHNEGLLGTVEVVYEAGHQDLIAMSYKGKEILIPINDDIVREVDREGKIIKVNLPDGLLDLFLKD